MKYEFRANGTVKIVMSPENSLEREFFNILTSSGGAEVITIPNTDEIIITKKQTDKTS